ncbi:MAG TPA: hypothetical protein VN684_11005 [Terriglobales bacterium]|jgi:hypothetical protein|nr:hypothetical protein [Terriglobales bacterium]
MRLPLWIKLLWTLWVMAWLPLYWKCYGAQNFLYFCDLGNLLILAGLWLESSLIFSWEACGLLVFQTLYAVDLIGAWFFHKHWIGGTEFMFDASVPFYLRMFSLFHIVVPPLLLWGVWRLGYDKRGWKYQTVLCWIVVPINHYWRPLYNVNWARGLGHEQHLVPGLAYLLSYLILVPAVVYWPTHLVLQRWMKNRQIKADTGR